MNALTRTVLEKLIFTQLVKKFSTFCGTQRYIRYVHSGLQLASILSQIQSSLHLGLSDSLLLSHFLSKILYTYLPCMLHALPISSCLDFITLIIFGEECKLISSSLCSFLSLIASFPFSSNILLRTLFSNILSQYAFLWVKDLSFPIHTNQRIKSMVLCILSSL